MFRALFSRPAKKAAPAVIATGDSPKVLRNRLFQALAIKDHVRAANLLEELESREPTAPRWPHKRGDVLRLLGRDRDAFVAYANAVRLYSELGKSNLATAMAKTAQLAFPEADRMSNLLDPQTQAAFYAASASTDSMMLDGGSMGMAVSF